jgi:predicted TIM-barrel fold metal-dependent hydrolase
VQRFAVDYPSLPIIVPHFGAGFFREALMLAEACSNVVLDTSSTNGWVRYHPGLTLTDVFRTAMAVVGPDRLMFGTDSSFFPRGWQAPIYDTQRAILEQLGTEDGYRAAIFGGTFNRLFPG